MPYRFEFSIYRSQPDFLFGQEEYDEVSVVASSEESARELLSKLEHPTSNITLLKVETYTF